MKYYQIITPSNPEFILIIQARSADHARGLAGDLTVRKVKVTIYSEGGSK